MDKDDKKKMGDEKFNLYRRVRKTLQGKNTTSRDLAGRVEAIIEGREDEKDRHEGGDGESRGGGRSRSRSGGKGRSRSRSPARKRKSSRDKRREKEDEKI